MGEIRQTIAQNIKKICALRGIRQIEVAEALGVSSAAVSNWFKGTNSLDIETLAALCKFLGITIDQAFGFQQIDSDVILSEEEAQLLAYFRSLNDDGRALLLKTADAVAGNPDYRSDPE